METEAGQNPNPNVDRQKTDELSGITALLQFLKERRRQRRLNLGNG